MNATGRRGWLPVIALLTLSLLLIPLAVGPGGVKVDYTLVTVAAGGAVLGVVCGVLGSFAVLRQQSLLGDALSHAALPGVALAFLLAGRELGWLLLGAGIASWLGVLLINGLVRSTRLKQDAAMGIVLTAFFALGITLLTYIQSRNDASQAGLDQFIFGQAAAIRRQDVMLISAVGLAAFAILVALWKEFKLITFDPDFAHANGFRLRLLDVLLSTLIVVAIVLGLQLAGVILMVGLLIAPAVAARQWTQQLGQMLTLAGIFGGIAGAGGAVLSGLQQGLPTGPLIIVAASAIVLVSITLAPQRGLLWRAWQNRRDRRRFAAQQLLQDIHRHALQHGDAHYPAPGGMLVALRGPVVRRALRQLQGAGLLQESAADAWSLSPTGQQRAQCRGAESAPVGALSPVWRGTRSAGSGRRPAAPHRRAPACISHRTPRNAAGSAGLRHGGAGATINRAAAACDGAGAAQRAAGRPANDGAAHWRAGGPRRRVAGDLPAIAQAFDDHGRHQSHGAAGHRAGLPAAGGAARHGGRPQLTLAHSGRGCGRRGHRGADRRHPALRPGEGGRRPRPRLSTALRHRHHPHLAPDRGRAPGQRRRHPR